MLCANTLNKRSLFAPNLCWHRLVSSVLQVHHNTQYALYCLHSLNDWREYWSWSIAVGEVSAYGGGHMSGVEGDNNVRNLTAVAVLITWIDDMADDCPPLKRQKVQFGSCSSSSTSHAFSGTSISLLYSFHGTVVTRDLPIAYFPNHAAQFVRPILYTQTLTLNLTLTPGM